MAETNKYDTIVGTVMCSPSRPATPTEVWVDLLSSATIALNDLLVIDGGTQQLLGNVVDVQLTEREAANGSDVRARSVRDSCAKLSILSASDRQQRPPEGSRVRRARAEEVTELLAEARQIPQDRRVALGVIAIQDALAPVYADFDRLAGPVATSMLITGTAGSLKSTAGLLAIISAQRLTQGNLAAVIVNTKGGDYLFADCSRQRWSNGVRIPHLRERDIAMYQALGFPEPPTLGKTTVFVPDATESTWRSMRPINFPRTQTYRLSYASGLRYTLAPTEEAEWPASVVTRQCIEEIASNFAKEQNITDLPALVDAVEAEFLALPSERARWRNQFLATTLAAALRQLRTMVRDVGPLLGSLGEPVALPVEQLANGGTWVVDTAHLPQRAAQAVIDEIVTALWQAKALGVIPHTMPLLLLVDEMNSWNPAGFTGAAP